MNRFRSYVPHAKDWDFIVGIASGMPSRMLPALFCAYLASWRHAAISEPAEHRKDNAGRRAANIRMRESVQGIKRNDARTMAIYTRLLTSGPTISCATCSKCNLEGICTISGDPVGKPCDKWKADFTV